MKRVSPLVRLVVMALVTSGVILLVVGIKSKPGPQEVVSMLNQEVAVLYVQGVRFTYQLKLTGIIRGSAYIQYKVICHNVIPNGRPLFSDGSMAGYKRANELLKPYKLKLDSTYFSDTPILNREENTMSIEIPYVLRDIP